MKQLIVFPFMPQHIGQHRQKIYNVKDYERKPDGTTIDSLT